MAKIQLTLFATPIATSTSRGAASSDQKNLRSLNKQVEGLFTIDSKTSYEFVSARDVSATTPITLECDPEQIAEVELTDGGILFLRLDELLALSKNTQARSAGKSQSNKLVIRSTTSLAGMSGTVASRGFTDLIKSISFLDIEWQGLLKQARKPVDVKRIASHFVDKLQTDKESFLKWNHQSRTWQAVAGKLPKSEQPLLILIHGTASSTEGSFGDLWAEEDVAEAGNNNRSRQSSIWLDFINTYYYQRVYAFEHDTLTLSPVKNAIDLLQLLPQGQTVHLLSHSRGGLVGELLCFANSTNKDGDPISREDIELYCSAYDSAVPDRAIEELKQLNKQLRGQAPVVERFVRVACPIRGTTLAGGRLDIYLSVLATAVQWFARIADPKIAETVDVLKSFAIVAAKKRFELGELPGLESMIPGRGLVRLLNNHDGRIDSALMVIAGNAQADGFSRQTLLVALSNSYYWKQNDFVVETSAMRGGLQRTDPPVLLLDKNQDVNHFSYFKNRTSLKWLYEGLKPFTGKRSVRDRAASSATTRSSSATENGSQARSIEATGTTFIIPAFAATHLLVGGERVWLDTAAIAAGKLQQLNIESTPQAATDGWIEDRYRAFANYLEQVHSQNIVSFEYDWRLSTADNARQLTEFMQLTLKGEKYASLPVRIIAHSTGGYIILKALRQSATLRKLLVEKHDMQLFLAGTPFDGTFHALEMLNGVSPLLPYLTLLDRQHNAQQLRQMFAGFPGMVDMLPSSLENMQVNKALHKQLGSKPEYKHAYANRVHYIAGSYPRTPCAMRTSDEFVTTGEGDGSARWEKIPEWITGDHVWYMENTMHGNLLAQPGSFQALAELVIKGETRQLSHTRPLSRQARSLKHKRLNKEQMSLLYPDEADIANVILRAQAVTASTHASRIMPTAHIRIVSGDLRYVRQPIVVGHYLQDGIKSAEAEIDKRLEYWLSNLYRKNLYPGKLGSAQVVTQKGLQKEAFGAVVVGLGVIGSLTPRTLRSTLRNGFIKFGLHQRELRNNCGFSQDMVSPVSLTSLLIGAGSGGVSIQDSLMAILSALSEANQILLDMHCPPIVQLDIIELYEDIAISAARALQKIKSLFNKDLTVEPLIIPVKGMRKRAASVADDSWWQHIQVLAHKNGSLTFSPLTSRAGMDTTILDTQAELIDTLIKQSTHDTRFNRQFSQTLFKLLIPNGLKDQVMNDNGIVLLLNKQAATYPWEMLVPGDERKKRRAPFATEIGLIRKLHTVVDKSRPAVVNQQVMIVGDPCSSFPELPGAQREARVVEQSFVDTVFETGNNTLVRARGVDIISRVMNTEVQILHLAGHGIYIPAGESFAGRKYKNGLAGMVLGDGIFLTESEVHQLEFIPELIFINCCHLGKTITDRASEDKGDTLFLTDSRAALAANLGTALIEAGAKCVVAAGWEVDDDAALEFASQFYENMIHKGKAFGEACKQARSTVYNKFPRSNTWGAYQCYGDPSFRFNKTKSDRKGKNAGNNEEFDVFHSPYELTVWSQNICARPEFTPEQQQRIIKEVRSRDAGLPDSWLQDASVMEALGNVYARMDEDVAALKCYQRAMQAENSSLSLKALEQRVRLQIRLSEQMFEFYIKFKTMRNFDESYIESALQEIEVLLKFGETVERQTLKAHLYRHYALVKISHNNQSAGLRLMRKAYQLISANSEKVYEKTVDYSFSRYACLILDVVSIAVGLHFNDKGKTETQYIQQLERLLEQLQRKARTNDFFDQDSILRCKLLMKLLLVKKTPGQLNLDDLQDSYEDLLENAAKKDQSRVLRQLLFLVSYLKKSWSKMRQPAVKELQAMYEQLEFVCNTPYFRKK